MQHHSSLRKDSHVAAAAVLNVIKSQEPAMATEPYRLHVAAGIKYTTTKKPYNPYRRYTIDDNGGSYEGL